ncbi:unnamed protein product, partial [Symbiodinium microadriaticum]
DEDCPVVCTDSQKKCPVDAVRFPGYLTDYTSSEDFISDREVCVDANADCPCAARTPKDALAPSKANLVCPCAEGERQCDVKDYTSTGELATRPYSEYCFSIVTVNGGCVAKGNCQPGQNMKKCKGLKWRLPWQYVQSWVMGHLACKVLPGLMSIPHSSARLRSAVMRGKVRLYFEVCVANLFYEAAHCRVVRALLQWTFLLFLTLGGTAAGGAGSVATSLQEEDARVAVTGELQDSDEHDIEAGQRPATVKEPPSPKRKRSCGLVPRYQSLSRRLGALIVFDAAMLEFEITNKGATTVAPASVAELLKTQAKSGSAGLTKALSSVGTVDSNARGPAGVGVATTKKAVTTRAATVEAKKQAKLVSSLQYGQWVGTGDSDFHALDHYDHDNDHDNDHDHDHNDHDHDHYHDDHDNNYDHECGSELNKHNDG